MSSTFFKISFFAIVLLFFSNFKTLPSTPMALEANFSFENACLNQPVLFTDLSMGDVVSWNWTFSNLGTSQEQDPEFTFPGTGVFLVELIIADSISQDTLVQEVVIEATSFVNFDTTFCRNETFVFNGQQYTYNDSGNYFDVDTLSTVGGCDSIVTVTMRVNDCGCEILFPNVFTPDNDGINDNFKAIVHCDLEILNYRMFIFDQWGETVFDSYEIAKAWDGTLNGYPLPRGVFVFYVRYEIDDGMEIKSVSEVKDLTLIR